ncbi:MAG TPA: hypothetical protein VGJ32_15480 [Solirubrobacteraceae bacterium]
MNARPSLAAVAALLLVPATASAAPRTAQLADVHGSGHVVAYGNDHPEGAPLAGTKLDDRHVYELSGVTATVRFGGTTYRVSDGTNFALYSYGFSKADKRLKPAISLLAGKLEVQTAAKGPGGVATEEGLFNPLPGGPWKIRFVVERRLADAKQLTPIGRAMFFGNAAQQPRGTTTVRSVGRPALNITPYVGKRIGSCRHAHGSRLTTKSGYGKGTATYSGLTG